MKRKKLLELADFIIKSRKPFDMRTFGEFVKETPESKCRFVGCAIGCGVMAKICPKELYLDLEEDYDYDFEGKKYTFLKLKNSKTGSLQFKAISEAYDIDITDAYYLFSDFHYPITDENDKITRKMVADRIREYVTKHIKNTKRVKK